METLTLNSTLEYLPERPQNSHKGDFGHVLVVGGDYGMGGAVRLAGEAALRTGAGAVSIATRPEHAFSILGNCPELMCHGIQEAEKLNPLLTKATVIVVGPGIGLEHWGSSLFKKVLETHLPLIIDAQALHLFAHYSSKRSHLPSRHKRWILTPHPGEAAELLNITPQDIQKDRLNAVTEIQKRYGGIIVLKGAGTLISSSASIAPNVCLEGNPGMATAGMGDVLSGIIAGLIAQGLSLEQAAKLGVCLHASAGDQSAAAAGERGMKASDLFPFLRNLLNPIILNEK
jgi:hydroxyethylthiazole kinase-like uncharacterized protein yjeF